MLHYFPQGKGPARLGRSPKLYRALRDRVKSGQVDLIHSHILWQMVSTYPARAVRGTPTKLVASPRGSLSETAMKQGSAFKPVFWRLLQQRALAAADCLHATSMQEYEDIRRLGFRQPVCVLPNGVEIPNQGPGHTPRRKEVLYLGRLHRIKGLENLLQAWAQVTTHFPDWSLRIAGPTESYGRGPGHATQLKDMAAELRLERVIFDDPKYGEEKFATYRQAAIYVLPSYSENFGMTVAEALASGTPAITTKGTPWQDLRASGAGWWIDIGVAPLAKALEEAMSTPMEKLDDMGRAGCALVRRDYDWANIAQSMNEVYGWLLAKGDRPSCVHVE
jgi:glycosyltransferase involved in cell wall biosynthesis